MIKPLKFGIQKKGECIKTLKEHNGNICSLLKLNSNEIISGSWDNTIKIWNLEKNECIKTLNGHTSGVRCLLKLNDDKKYWINKLNEKFFLFDLEIKFR